MKKKKNYRNRKKKYRAVPAQGYNRIIYEDIKVWQKARHIVELKAHL